MTDDPIDEYLWNGNGEADPQIQRLEHVLSRYRHARPLRPPTDEQDADLNDTDCDR